MVSHPGQMLTPPPSAGLHPPSLSYPLQHGLAPCDQRALLTNPAEIHALAKAAGLSPEHLEFIMNQSLQGQGQGRGQQMQVREVHCSGMYSPSPSGGSAVLTPGIMPVYNGTPGLGLPTEMQQRNPQPGQVQGRFTGQKVAARSREQTPPKRVRSATMTHRNSMSTPSPSQRSLSPPDRRSFSPDPSHSVDDELSIIGSDSPSSSPCSSPSQSPLPKRLKTLSTPPSRPLSPTASLHPSVMIRHFPSPPPTGLYQSATPNHPQQNASIRSPVQHAQEPISNQQWQMTTPPSRQRYEAITPPIYHQSSNEAITPPIARHMSAGAITPPIVGRMSNAVRSGNTQAGTPARRELLISSSSTKPSPQPDFAAMDLSKAKSNPPPLNKSLFDLNHNVVAPPSSGRPLEPIDLNQQNKMWRPW